MKLRLFSDAVTKQWLDRSDTLASDDGQFAESEAAAAVSCGLGFGLQASRIVIHDYIGVAPALIGALERAAGWAGAPPHLPTPGPASNNRLAPKPVFRVASRREELLGELANAATLADVKLVVASVIRDQVI